MDTAVLLPICKKHNVEKTRIPTGPLICKHCNKEQAKSRAGARIASGVPPTDCPKCEGSREWDTFGRPKCKLCANNEVRKWREDNPDKFREGRQRHYLENKDRILQNNRDYIEKNREKVNKMRADYQARHDREYWVWKGMNARCYNPDHKQYKDWGGRGVQIHESWRRDPSLTKDENYARYEKYKKYIDDTLGPRPSDKHSIDRYPDRNGNYEPGNIRWASPNEQANNTRKNVAYKNSIPDNSPIYYPHGNLITLKEFSDQVKLPLIIAKYRYAHTWDTEWILSDEEDGRYYEYLGRKYNMKELSLISGLKFETIRMRVHKGKMTIKEAVENPVS